MQRFDRLGRALASLPHANLFAESLFELMIIIAFLKAYNMTRNLFGSQACTPEFALGHAQQIIWLEQLTGLFWEQEIQSECMLGILPLT